MTRGERYYSPITLDKEGTYEITAVAVDDRGIKSEVASAKYEIEFEAPDAPEIDPDGGTFGAQTDITITVPEKLQGILYLGFVRSECCINRVYSSNTCS